MDLSVLKLTIDTDCGKLLGSIFHLWFKYTKADASIRGHVWGLLGMMLVYLIQRHILHGVGQGTDSGVTMDDQCYFNNREDSTILLSTTATGDLG
eukprot:scaffold80450_cov35-Attheya_sp.AAC.3